MEFLLGYVKKPRYLHLSNNVNQNLVTIPGVFLYENSMGFVLARARCDILSHFHLPDA